MRNLRQYPVTDEEILKLIDTLIQEESDVPLDERPTGDMKLIILRKAKMRYQDLLNIEYEVNHSY
jgi:hypothetical protein